MQVIFVQRGVFDLVISRLLFYEAEDLAAKATHKFPTLKVCPANAAFPGKIVSLMRKSKRPTRK